MSRVLAWMTVLAWTSLACVQARPAPEGWVRVFAESFRDDSYRPRWRLEGLAQLELRHDQGDGYLRVTTQTSPTDKRNHHSVLWCRERFEGDVWLRFRARGERRNAAILYLNARTTKGSRYHTIFDWQRPDAQEKHYSASPDFEAYTLGYLRAGECRLRHVGGVTGRAWPEPWTKESVSKYARESILVAYQPPYGERTDEWHDFDVRMVGPRLTVEIDGGKVIDLEDTGRTPKGSLAWQPLVGGGWIGFRNFRPTWVDIDALEVFCREK